MRDATLSRPPFQAPTVRYSDQAAALLRLQLACRSDKVRIADLVFEVRVAGGRLSTSEGRATNPDAILTLAVETLNALMFQLLTPAAALASGRVKIEKGDQKALERFVKVVGFHKGLGNARTSARG